VGQFPVIRLPGVIEGLCYSPAEITMTCHLTKRWGEGISDPSLTDLQSALAELDKEDPEHPDCWLQDENGWAISAFGSGLLTFENVETNEGPWHMRGVSREVALQLWELLKAGDLNQIRQRRWLPGYGSRPV
jgi:hypothetical protein